MIFQILSALFLGSGLASLFSRLIIKYSSLRLFRLGIPSFTPELVETKTFDLLEFGLAFVFTFLIFLFNYFWFKKFKPKNKVQAVLAWFYLAFSLIIFSQTHFTEYSAKATLMMFVLGQIGFLFLIRYLANQKEIKLDPIIGLNGFFTGFYFLLVINCLTNFFWWSLLILVSSLFLYFLFSEKANSFFKSPAHLLLILALFFPSNLKLLLILGGLVLILVLIIKEKVNLKPLYPLALIVLISYNPLFYIGNFDTVEEGFWLGWVQRLINGQILYRDTVVYHPPLIPWLMFGWMKLTNFSIYSERLFLHLLQILGLFIYWLVVKRTVKKPLHQLVVMFLALSLTQTAVRNNVEIRLGIGLLALLAWFNFFSAKKKKFLVLAGAVGTISLLVSLEVGLVTLITLIVLTLLFSESERLKKGVFLLCGALAVGLPVALILIAQGALKGFLASLWNYGQLFSQGYLNLPVGRAISTSFFRWHLFFEFLESSAWFWELTRMILFGFLLFIGIEIWQKKKRLSQEEKLLFGLAIFCLLLFRTALGRSDWEHLLFILLPVLILFFHLLEKFSIKSQYSWLIVFVLFFIFSGPWLRKAGSFLDRWLFQLQTYNRPTGSYQSWDFDRAGILIEETVGNEDLKQLLGFLDQETGLNDSIFVFPWRPEIYFLANRKNSTSFDTPLAFVSEDYQNQMIKELEEKPGYVIFEPEKAFADLSSASLSMVDQYLKDHYRLKTSFGLIQVLEPKE